MYRRTTFSLLCIALYVNCTNTEILNDVCTSAICVNESMNLLNYMDQTIDPCDNFYDFACGKHIRETVLPEDKSNDLSFFKLQDKVREQIRDVLMEESKPNELHTIKLAKDFVKICTDEKTLNAAGTKPMLEYLEKYGGWPVLKGESGWNEDNWDWLNVKRQIFDDGFLSNQILEFSIGTDLKNTSKRIIYVSETKKSSENKNIQWKISSSIRLIVQISVYRKNSLFKDWIIPRSNNITNLWSMLQ